MRCQRIQPLLLDFSSGRLDARAAAGVAAHVAGCADCHRALERERRTAALLGSMTRVEPRADAWPAVAAALHLAARQSRPWAALRASAWKPMVWAGGLAAAAALGVNLLAPSPRSAEAPPLTRAYSETEVMQSLAPTTAAGLGQERDSDPLAAMQRRTDRLLDAVADQRS